MKHSLLFSATISSLFLMNACAPQMTWEHTSFSKKPEIKLEQAKLICRGAVSNAQNSIAPERAPDNIQCNVYSSSVSCRNNNGWGQVAANIRTNQRKRIAANTAYTSCMAQHGWKAHLVNLGNHSKKIVAKPISERRMVKCKKRDGEIISTEILLQTCVEGYKGSPL